MTASRYSICVLLAIALITPASAKKDKEADPAEIVLGERLFLETRFAQFFRAFVASGHGVNDPLPAGDSVMDTTLRSSGTPLAGPFAGSAMNCRQCHLVD